MSDFCLVLLCPASVEEKLLDVLLGPMGDKGFTSVSAFSHGPARGRLSSLEQVMGRSATVQVQVLVTEEQMNDLLQRLRNEFHGTGLRYWASPVAVEGEIE